MTTGIKFDTYSASDSKDKLDIVLKFTDRHSSIEQIDNFRIFTTNAVPNQNNSFEGGHFVPLSSFISKTYQHKEATIQRDNGVQITNINADVKNDINLMLATQKLKTWLKNDPNIPNNIKIEFKGEQEDQKEAVAFGKKSFIISIALIAIILITQFNSIFHMLLIITSIFMSIAGLLMGVVNNQSKF